MIELEKDYAPDELYIIPRWVLELLKRKPESDLAERARKALDHTEENEQFELYEQRHE